MDPNPNPDLSSQGSLGSMSAGGVSTDTPKTVLETPRDPIDDFHSSGSEPTDNNSSRVSVDTIPAVGGALADAVGLHFVKTVKANHQFGGEGSLEGFEYFSKRVTAYAHDLMMNEGLQFGIYPPPARGGDDAGVGGSGSGAGDPGSGADSASKSEALERTLKRKERDTDN